MRLIFFISRLGRPNRQSSQSISGYKKLFSCYDLVSIHPKVESLFFILCLVSLYPRVQEKKDFFENYRKRFSETFLGYNFVTSHKDLNLGK